MIAWGSSETHMETEMTALDDYTNRFREENQAALAERRAKDERLAHLRSIAASELREVAVEFVARMQAAGVKPKTEFTGRCVDVEVKTTLGIFRARTVTTTRREWEQISTYFVTNRWGPLYVSTDGLVYMVEPHCDSDDIFYPVTVLPVIVSTPEECEPLMSGEDYRVKLRAELLELFGRALAQYVP